MAKSTTIDIDRIREIPRQDGRPSVAIVFVHGFTGDYRSTWGNLPEYMKQMPELTDWGIYSFRYNTRFLPDIVGVWRADADISKLALRLKTTIETEFANHESLALVAHSMGGLVVQRALLDYEDLRRKIQFVALFGTPSDGLRKASPFAFWKRQIRDMVEGSPFVAKLRSDWRTKFSNGLPFRFIASVGEQDEFVPAETAILPFEEKYRAAVPGDHVSMIKPQDPEERCVLVLKHVLTEDSEAGGPLAASMLAAERGDFQKLVDEWWPDRMKLDRVAAGRLALALDRVDRRKDAIEYLESRTDMSPDTIGILAGRYKREWLARPLKEFGDRALDRYVEAFMKAKDGGDADAAFYNGINVAFMSLAYYRNWPRAVQYAKEALEYCAKSTNPNPMWRFATEGEANLVMKQFDDALAAYAKAVALVSEPWECISMKQQALRTADLCGFTNARDVRRLKDVFRGQPS